MKQNIDNYSILFPPSEIISFNAKLNSWMSLNAMNWMDKSISLFFFSWISSTFFVGFIVVNRFIYADVPHHKFHQKLQFYKCFLGNQTVKSYWFCQFVVYAYREWNRLWIVKKLIIKSVNMMLFEKRFGHIKLVIKRIMIWCCLYIFSSRNIIRCSTGHIKWVYVCADQPKTDINIHWNENSFFNLYFSLNKIAE